MSRDISARCLAKERVTALGLSYEHRSQIARAVGAAQDAGRGRYQTGFLNNDLYAEITVSGALKENDERSFGPGRQEIEGFRSKYKFFVERIEEINILAEEIFPSDEARGVRIVKQ